MAPPVYGVDTTRRISEEQWRSFITVVRGNAIDEIPDEGPAAGSDGAGWELESSIRGRYRKHEAWSPDCSYGIDAERFVRIACAIVKLGGALLTYADGSPNGYGQAMSCRAEQ
jgi:hypothetical protein